MICFTWWGLTQYAARAIEAFNQVSKEPVVVVATRPKSSPVEGMERILSCPLVWVEETDTDVLSRLPEVPRVVLVSNWNLPCWQELMTKTRDTGGKVVAMVDTNYQLSLRGLLRAVRFRLFLKRRFDAFLVVGASGLRLMRLWGVPSSKVFQGLYGADASLFHNGLPLTERPKRILYVGQFINRKNVLRLVKAFGRFHAKFPDWELEMCGHGPLRDQMPKMKGLVVHDFVQPEELAGIYRQARGFILPSLEEHWGVVVHEAALSGCFLILSRTVGAAEDFAGCSNSSLFSPGSVNEIERSLEFFASRSDDELVAAQKCSLALAERLGLHRFVSEMQNLVCTIGRRG